LEEIGAESYDQVDTILQRLISWRSRERDMFQTIPEQYECFLKEHKIQGISDEIIEAVAKRHFASEFKRKQLPIKITRDEIL
jgi:NH3-dependent NAD+ synthetase